MSDSEVKQSEKLRSVLDETTDFIKKHGLKVLKISPSVAGLPLQNFDSQTLKTHKTVHISITIETENPSTSETEETRSNLVASHLYENDPPNPQFNIPTMHLSATISTIMDNYLTKHVNNTLEAALVKSKVEFPNYESQLNKIYEILKQNLCAELSKDGKSRTELQSKLSNIFETSTVYRTAATQAISGLHGAHVQLDVSRINHSYLHHKINEIFEENKSKLISDVKNDSKVQGIDKSSNEAERIALQRLLHHYDALKSRVIFDMEKTLNQSIIDGELGAALGKDWRELILQGFLRNTQEAEIEASAKDQGKESDLNQSTRLKEELRNYISQLFQQNLQSSSFK